MSIHTPRRQRLASGLAVARLAVLHVVLGGLKRVVPVSSLAAWAARPGRIRPTPADLAIGRVLRAGALVGSPDRDCLQRSVLLYRELRRIGAPAALAVGFRRVDDRLAGHAWVLLDGRVVGEPVPDIGRFVPVMTYGAEGSAAAIPPAPHE
jgi:hypothetical protein